MIENNKHVTRLAAVLLCALCVLAVRPAAAAEAYGRSYALHTLDYRIAETLVWKICEDEGSMDGDCYIQNANPGSLMVVAPQQVHARVVEMLTERDRRMPSSLLFEIVLIRLAEGGPARGQTPVAGHLQKAMDAVLEIFPDRKPEVVDTSLIRTVREGRTRLGNESVGFYDATLRVRDSSSGENGLEFTVDLEISQGKDDGFVRHLGSTLTIQEGETVVAGSSRMGDQTAIVVLLTSKASR